MAKISKIQVNLNDIKIVPINSKYNRGLIDFKTEITELKSFLIDDALENQNQKISLTFLWFYKDQLIGYVSLLNDKINLEGNLKTYFKEKDVLYKSLPALKIGRLCVHDSFRRMGFGRLMMVFVIQKAELIGDNIAGCRFITLDAKRNTKKELDSIYFYKDIGFKVLK